MSGGFDAFWAPKSHTPSPFTCLLLGSSDEFAIVAPGHSSHPRWSCPEPLLAGSDDWTTLHDIKWVRWCGPGLLDTAPECSPPAVCVEPKPYSRRLELFTLSRAFMIEPESDSAFLTESFTGLAWINLSTPEGLNRRKKVGTPFLWAPRDACSCQTTLR